MSNLQKALRRAVPTESFLGIGNLGLPAAHLHRVLNARLKIRRLINILLDMLLPQAPITIILRVRRSR